MSEPEIDRRCKVCGAAVRPRSVFCPQCGQEVNSRAKATEATAVVEASEAVVDFAETQPLTAIPELSKAEPLTRSVPEPVSLTNNPNMKKSSNVARAPEGNVLGRVGKLRKVSSVVIDQAAYDPSLRFLLVAACLFLLFIVLLILSKVLG
jgi:predicted RNA-binding Zn-ribbon protein involved in translation (DUF1610 family)